MKDYYIKEGGGKDNNRKPIKKIVLGVVAFLTLAAIVISVIISSTGSKSVQEESALPADARLLDSRFKVVRERIEDNYFINGAIIALSYNG